MLVAAAHGPLVSRPVASRGVLSYVHVQAAAPWREVGGQVDVYSQPPVATSTKLPPNSAQSWGSHGNDKSGVRMTIVCVLPCLLEHQQR